MRLADSGQFVGFVYEYEPERSVIAGASNDRESVASVAPFGVVGGLSVVPDEGVLPSPRSDVSGLETQDRQLPHPMLFVV